MFDLLIENGLVVKPEGAIVASLGVLNERIAAIAEPSALAGIPAMRSIDAGGKLVLPGGIDPHIHCDWPVQIEPAGGPPKLSAGCDRVSRAALFGGTTTLIDFAVWNFGTLARTIEAREAQWRGRSHCDYSFHVMLQGRIPLEILGELQEVITGGFPSVKIFTTNIRPSVRNRRISYGDIWEILQVTANAGGIAAIHAEEDEIVMHMYDKLIRQNRVGFEYMSEVHNTLSEDLAFRHIIRLAENVPGAALYMMHVSAASGIEAIREARGRRLPIYGETLHQYMLYTEQDYRRPNGQIYHTYPSLKSAEDQKALWAGTVRGEISAVATDGICTSLCCKLQGRRIDDVTGGNAGVEPRLSLMYSEMVQKRGYSLERFVELVSTNAARIMGLYPRKGVIAVGSDADLVIFDPAIRRRVTVENLHEADYTPWEGHEITGWPEITILRGRVVVENGAIRDEPRGVSIPRKIAEEIRGAPFC